MVKANGKIGDSDFNNAYNADVTVAQSAAQSAETPYFVDQVNGTTKDMFKDTDFQANAFRVYTTVDLRLQRLAADAINSGMDKVTTTSSSTSVDSRAKPLPQPAVALVAISHSYRTSEGDRRWPQLWHQPAQSRAVEPPARVDLQTFRFYAAAMYRGGRGARC